MTAGRRVNTHSTDWCTPPEIIEPIRQFLGVIHLDTCSNRHSLVRARVKYALPQDGLRLPWGHETIFVNPPYGRGMIRDWLEKCTSAARCGSEVIALIPVATNTRHWQQNVFLNASSICFLKVPRLKFLLDGKRMEKGAPMACALVYWGKRRRRFASTFRELGITVGL